MGRQECREKGAKIAIKGRAKLNSRVKPKVTDSIVNNKKSLWKQNILRINRVHLS